jgi:hypothetical protein
MYSTVLRIAGRTLAETAEENRKDFDEVMDAYFKKRDETCENNVETAFEEMRSAGILKRDTICPSKERYESLVKMKHEEISELFGKALDADYLTFKLKEKGELALDENGKIKGWEDKLAALKTQFPTQFETDGQRKYEPFKLKGNEPGGGGVPTKEQFKTMTYEQRLELKQKNEELYRQLKN